ncbi:MAG: AI-2E family transporter [Bacteroidales bacterium]|nr:AI-2E family transporter [Bacteroidales bacterium]
MKLSSWVIWLPTLIVLFVFIYFFPQILVLILTSLILSLMGNPLVQILDKIKIKNWHIPHSINAFIALLVVVGILVGFLWFMVPFLLHQLNFFIGFDYEKMLLYYQNDIIRIENFLKEYRFLKEEDTIQSLLATEIQNFLNLFNFQKFIQNLLSFVGNFTILIFSVLFISYYFLKDDKLFFKGLKLITPPSAHDEIARILHYSKKLLSRYFIGLVLEQIIMICLISLGMYILGIPSFFLIGFVFGVFNVIPYLGPLMGGFFGTLIGLASLPIESLSILFLPTILKMFLVFFISNMIDNFILQPNIYSRSVKAHPLEIFLIILMAGYQWGPLGMILAIPAYTLLRIIAVVLFGNWEFIQNMFRNFSEQLNQTRSEENKK